eukprot:6365200-Prymnesium_polylepis.2
MCAHTHAHAPVGNHRVMDARWCADAPETQSGDPDACRCAIARSRDAPVSICAPLSPRCGAVQASGTCDMYMLRLDG